MSGSSFNVTLEDVTAYDWEAVLAGADHPTCTDYHFRLFERASKLAEAGDEKGERVFRFLGANASLSLSSEEDDGPLSPFMIMGTRRSAALEDFGPAEIGLISDLVPKTRDPAMRARFADILWVARKNHKSAKAASEAYLDGFKRLDIQKDWVFELEGLRRGFGLAHILGIKNDPFSSYVSFIEEVLVARAGSEIEALSASLMDLLLEHEVGNYLKHATAAEQIAERIQSGGNYGLAQQYLELESRLRLAGKDEDGSRKARLRKGHSLIQQANDVVGKPGQGYMTGSHFQALGIECLRQARAPEEEIEHLHKQLREWQALSLKEMQTLRHGMDIGDVVEAAAAFVRGKNLVDAVLSFALGHGLISVSKLRERVIENASKFPLSHLMGATFLSHDGRFLAHKAPVIGVGKDLNEEGVQAELFSQARSVDWPFRVSAYIEPCRSQIYREHRPSQRELAFLVENNPAIPPGHQLLFLRGVHAGFRGDMVSCAHLLIPQIEELIRYVLRRSGVVTSKLDSKLVQEERLLGVLLAMPETVQILGESLVFELRGLLCEKFGFDLRNRLAHGFLTTDECYGVDVFVMWWLVLRLCSFPVYQSSAIPGNSGALPQSTPPA